MASDHTRQAAVAIKPANEEDCNRNDASTYGRDVSGFTHSHTSDLLGECSLLTATRSHELFVSQTLPNYIGVQHQAGGSQPGRDSS